MRKVRGAKSLVKFLESISCPMSESTIYRLLRNDAIPHKRISSGIIIFDLDAMDKWL